MQSPLRVAVVGGGTTGPAVALFLKREGHTLQLFERVPRLSPVGAGLLLQPTGMEVLHRLGLLQEILKHGAKVSRLHSETKSGKTFLHLNYSELSPGGYGLGLHRAVLCHYLFEAMLKEAIPLHLGTPISRMDINNSETILSDEMGKKHGPFAGLMIPNLADRNSNPEAYLPPTANHPNGMGVFLDIPSLANPGRTDLGLWNVFANQDVPTSQEGLLNILCEEFADQITTCTPDEILPLIIAYFKTSGLRDLGHSAPFFHNGQKDTLEEVIRHYIEFSNLARAGAMRNPSEEMALIALTENDVEILAAFLKSLNEDYN